MLKWKKIGNKELKCLYGEDGLKKLDKSKVAIFGIGGVGSFVVEGLVRAGIGNIVIIDPDDIYVTNINRQIHALHSTLGKSKVEIMKKRILDINPDICVEIYRGNDISDGEENLIDGTFSYVIDAVDTVTTKIKLIEKAKQENVPIISCMGTGNKLEPTKLEVADIYKTSVCPLAKVMRRELKKIGVEKLKVVYSKEEPIETKVRTDEGKRTPGSISFVPSVAGLIIAGEVVKDIIKEGE